MDTFDFTLKFRLELVRSIDTYLIQLSRNGCHDVLVDIEGADSISLRFSRIGDSFNEVVAKAVSDVRRSIPLEHGQLIEAIL